MIAALVASLMLTAAPTPVVIELFTSEGCSSCPVADVALKELVESPPEGVEVIALGMHVDYWDYLGWKDPFSSADFTERQQAYARRSEKRDVYTPQMILNGRDGFVGSGRAARQAISRADERPKLERLSVVISLGSRGLVAKVSGLTTAKADQLLLAVTERGLSTVPTRGENRGETLQHAPVTRSLRQATKAEAEAGVTFKVEKGWRPEQLRVVAFLQSADGRITAAGQSPVGVTATGSAGR